MTPERKPAFSIEPMTADDWPAVRRIYSEGIATGDATLEREAPDWGHFDRSHPAECRLVARSSADGVVGWTALGGYSARRSTAASRGKASTWRSRPAVAASAAPCSKRSSPASEAAGYWTLLAGVLAENERASPSTNASGSGGSVSSAGSARTLAAAGGTSSSSNAGARSSAPTERSGPTSRHSG